MVMASNTMNSLQKTKRTYGSLILWALIIFFLLFLRDAYSVGINKYIFLGITCVCAFYMKTSDLIYLYCFLFPLYVGLPGNYMTLVLVVRLLLETRRFKATSLVLTLIIAAFMVFQNYTTGKTQIVHMMYIPGLLVVLLLFTHQRKLESTPMILMYSAGVAAVGIIMLVSTLRVHSLTELMSNAFRLGSSNVDYVEGGIMNVSMDPNFYGLFSISAISLAFPVFLDAKSSITVKACLVIFAFVQLVVGLTGLSRAFILVLLLWIGLSLLSMKNTRSTILAVFTIIVFLILLVIYMSDVIDTALARFDDLDILDGNGRLSGVKRFWNLWSGNLYYFFMGTGLFRCNVHCMPLQYLFGGGLLMAICVFGLYISYKPPRTTRRGLAEKLPFLATFIMMCSVPAATLLNFMFPLILVGLCAHNK